MNGSVCLAFSAPLSLLPILKENRHPFQSGLGGQVGKNINGLRDYMIIIDCHPEPVKGPVKCRSRRFDKLNVTNSNGITNMIQTV